MKKYIVVILLIGIILVSILLVNTIRVEKERTSTFVDSGYILQSTTTKEQNVERYYFNSNETYKAKYDSKIIFDDTDGQEVTANKNNFIHYSDGSTSAFTNGVLLDLNNIESNPIQYYNISESSILKKEGNHYTINNLEQTLRFTDLIWKIDSNKYLILSNNIKLFFGEDETQTINGYVEIEYLDNEIVKIYNQEATYQTISSSAYIELPNDIKITLENKIVSKNDENKMSLESMVIDSDDNITIVDLNEENKENSEESNTVASNELDSSSENNQTTTNNNNSNNQNNSSQTIIDGISDLLNGNGNSNIDNGDSGNNNNNNNDNDNDNVSDDGNDNSGYENNNKPINTFKAPEYNIEEFRINTIGFDAIIMISDEENSLTGDSNIYVLENSTGKKVYEYVESLGVYNIELSVSSLKPNTQYTLVIESSYSVDGVEYTRNFVYRIFRTSVIGISIEKDVFTNNSLGLALMINKDTGVKSVDVILSDTTGNLIRSQTVEIDLSDTSADQRSLIEFSELDSNTDYVVSLTNVVYDGQILTNGYVEDATFKTLKDKPEISGTSYEINKREGSFALNLNNISDPDGGIQKYIFKIYDTRITDNSEPIKTIESSGPSAILKIDEETILRNVGYTFKVAVEFYDNEKIYEYESEFSNVFIMDGVEFPSVRFEQSEITFEKISGVIVVEDTGNTIDEDNIKFTVTYTDSTGSLKSFTSAGSFNIPVNINYLRANETYRFALYSTIDLQDGNEPIDECYIGGFVVQTKNPNNMFVDFTPNNNNLQSLFSVDVQLSKQFEDQGELEPQTLTGITVSIYAGQTVDGEFPTGSPLRTIKLVDNNEEPYESDLKAQMYDDSITITPRFFNASNDDFKDTYYTITVTNAYDYTEYPNQLPLINNVYTIETEGYMPDLPTDTENAVTVTPIRNYTQDTPREELNDNTIVGYEVKAVYDNSGLYAKEVIYSVYDSNTNELIDTVTIPIGEDGVIPTHVFDVLDGTPTKEVDDELRRGNTYYFTYEMKLDLDGDGEAETNYPYQEDIVLKSKDQTPEKQEPTIIMYPNSSTSDSMKFNYRFIDVDNATENNSQVTATINDVYADQKNLVQTLDNKFTTIEFENLNIGTLSIKISKTLVKADGPEDDELIFQYFEGERTLGNNLSYEITNSTNKISISFTDTGDTFRYITGIRVEFISVENPTNKLVKDFLTIPNNNIIEISYNEISSLVGTLCEVNVYAYYDSGIVGYDIESQYVAYQQNYTREGEQVYYYDINSGSQLIEDIEARGNMYNIVSRNENIFNISNLVTNRNTTVQFAYSKSGLTYQGKVVLQKQIKEAQLEYKGNNTIYFDVIVPGISLRNDNNEWEIYTELDKATLKAELSIDQTVTIYNNIIHMDFYQTDSEYKTEQFIKTIDLTVEQFKDTIELTDLTPQSYYFVKFWTEVVDSKGQNQKVFLFDLDYQTSGRSYYFSTLANVGLDNVEIMYEPENYSEKYINITYTLERVTGYDRIEYKLYHYDDTLMKYEKVDIEISNDQLFNETMNKKISINPGSGFIFGDTYKLEIVPIAEYIDISGEKVVLELGAVEQEFTFPILSEPTIAISGTREDNNQISFKVTIYDDDKVITNNGYTIRITNGDSQDVTPEEYKNQIFSVDTLNNIITLNDIESTQAYTITITTLIDKENTGIDTDIKEYERSYTVPSVNEYGISIGTITANQNSSDSRKVDLLFVSSYRLNEIDMISYTIYNTTGYSRTGKVDFLPTQINSDDEVYYRFPLDDRLSDYGRYYIEIQFIMDNEVIDNASIEYVYLQA